MNNLGVTKEVHHEAIYEALAAAGATDAVLLDLVANPVRPV